MAKLPLANIQIYNFNSQKISHMTMNTHTIYRIQIQLKEYTNTQVNEPYAQDLQDYELGRKQGKTLTI